MDDVTVIPSFFSDFLDSVGDFFANYGWHLVISLAIAIVVYEKYLKSNLQKYKAVKDEREYAAKYHKNPDLFIARQLAQEKRTKQFEERYKQAAEQYKQKMEEKAQKKQEEILETHLNGGHVLGSSSNPKSKSFKPEYNPLMGSSNGSTYKPPKRSACGKGGCG